MCKLFSLFNDNYYQNVSNNRSQHNYRKKYPEYSDKGSISENRTVSDNLIFKLLCKILIIIK